MHRARIKNSINIKFIFNSEKARIPVGAGLDSARGCRGITLIALIITVIVLLILAGVALNFVIGENGILKHAEFASNKYQNSAEKEENDINNMMDIMNEFGIASSTRENLADLTQGTATEEDISQGKTAWVNGKMLTGNNNNNFKAYVLGSIATYSTSTSQYAAYGYSSDRSYFTCTGSTAINYLTINVLKDMNITIVLQDAGRGIVTNRTIEVNNTTITTAPMSIGSNYLYETTVSNGDIIKITADRSDSVRGIAILILGK